DPGLRRRFLDQALVLKKAFALAGTTDEAAERLNDVAFFEAARRQILKLAAAGGEGQKSDEELDTAINQIISEAVVADGVIDLFADLGGQEEISILSDEFLENLQRQPHQNLQMELLKRLLADKVRSVGRINLVQSRKFSEKLA